MSQSVYRIPTPPAGASGTSVNNNAAIQSPGAPPRVAVAAARRTSVAWLATVIFGAIVLIPSMAGFVIKFGEMIALTKGIGDESFAITPVINYLLASGGFLFLLLWAARNGMFRDLEHPKYQMLEQERRLDGHE